MGKAADCALTELFQLRKEIEFRKSFALAVSLASQGLILVMYWSLTFQARRNQDDGPWLMICQYHTFICNTSLVESLNFNAI